LSTVETEERLWGAVMAQFLANAQMSDPRYQNFKVLVKFDGRVVAAANDIQLSTRSEVAEYRPGGYPTLAVKAPGRLKYDAITLKRGLTYDTGFGQWAAGARQKTVGPRPLLFCKDVTLEFYSPAGVKIKTGSGLL